MTPGGVRSILPETVHGPPNGTECLNRPHQPVDSEQTQGERLSRKQGRLSPLVPPNNEVYVGVAAQARACVCIFLGAVVAVYACVLHCDRMQCRLSPAAPENGGRLSPLVQPSASSKGYVRGSPMVGSSTQSRSLTVPCSTQWYAEVHVPVYPRAMPFSHKWPLPSAILSARPKQYPLSIRMARALGRRGGSRGGAESALHAERGVASRPPLGLAEMGLSGAWGVHLIRHGRPICSVVGDSIVLHPQTSCEPEDRPPNPSPIPCHWLCPCPRLCPMCLPFPAPAPVPDHSSASCPALSPLD